VTVAAELLPLDGWTRRIDRCEANVAPKRISAIVRQILDVYSAYVRMVYGYLHSRVANNHIPAKCVSLNSRSQIYSIRVSDHGVLLDHVSRVSARNKTNAKVVLLG
jgi:hypothetical protein